MSKVGQYNSEETTKDLKKTSCCEDMKLIE